MKRWLLFLPAMLFGCPQFAPDDVCGYPGFCDGSVGDAGDGGKDGSVTCPSGKEPKDDPSCVSETLGIFVAPAPTGNDSNAGTKSAPVATLKTALAKVGAKSFIFVCEGSYSESVDIKQSAAIFGGFKCSDWSYSATTLPKFTATKPDYVFHLDGANNTIIGDLELDAMDGAVGTGQSSIGVFVANSQSVKFERTTIHAGKGADGTSGTLQPIAAQWPDAGVLRGSDAPGPDGGTANTVPCPGGSGTTIGGKGGNADGLTDGISGLPALGGGDGGTGGTQSISCSGGLGGKNALVGDAGAAPTTTGDLTSAGWMPSSGGPGAVGGPGQGGGGGGGRDDGQGSQGGGGGGGAGGCGGSGGGGGSAGGGSIAIASFQSGLTLSTSNIVCTMAGLGGSGVAGEAGQSPGGKGGFSTVFPTCSGGNGGAGGSGGGGAGGAGGVSVGVLSKGGTVTVESTTTITVANQGGAKGTGAAGNDGIPGVAQPTLAL